MKNRVVKRVFMATVLPILGILVVFLLNYISGPGYTTSVNQTALVVYFKGSVIWSVAAIITGVYMYSKCSSMNHLKFIIGITSVALGAAMPWIVV